MQPIMDLLNLPSHFASIIKTSDGHFLAQVYGDVGFNHFLGQPAFHNGPGKDRSRQTWKRLTFREKRTAIKQANLLSLSLKEMLR